MLKLATGLIYCFIGNPRLIFPPNCQQQRKWHKFFPSVRAKNQPVTHLSLVFPRTSYDRAALVVADEQHLQTVNRTFRYTFELQPASLREPIKQRYSWGGSGSKDKRSSGWTPSTSAAVSLPTLVHKYLYFLLLTLEKHGLDYAVYRGDYFRVARLWRHRSVCFSVKRKIKRAEDNIGYCD